MNFANIKFLKLIAQKGLQESDGATAIEYALIASLVAVTLVLSLTNIGTKLMGFFLSIAGAL